MARFRQFFQYICAGRVAAAFAAFLAALNLQLFEQHLTQLLGRTDGECMPRQFINCLFKYGDARAEILGERGERRRVDANAAFFHCRKYGHQWALNGFVQCDEMIRDYLRLQHLPKAKGNVSILGGIGQRLIERHFGKGNA